MKRRRSSLCLALLVKGIPTNMLFLEWLKTDTRCPELATIVNINIKKPCRRVTGQHTRDLLRGQARKAQPLFVKIGCNGFKD
ncbi:hypothetical protein GGR51DRAFT_517255 [Nemania sp. FL0031]|nr:hypothetical protein GGR51DRAFT_517255 [Nemania sp. FL0031]